RRAPADDFDVTVNRFARRAMLHAACYVSPLRQQGGVGMSIVNRLGSVAVAAVLAIGLTAPTGAQAQDGRIAAGVTVGAFRWGPSPPFYPYYHFGEYGVPVGWSGPFWGPGPVPEAYEYGCHIESVRTGHHWRRVRVCD